MGWMTLTLKPCIDHGTCMFSRLLVLDHGVDSIQVTAVTTITNCFFRNIWIVTGELLDAFPARDDQNHPVTHVCVCKGMRGLYTILMDRHCFCWRRLDDGSLSVETSPWLLSFIDLIYVNHKSCAFQKKTNPIFVGCTRIVCFIAIPNLLYCLSPFPLRLLVESLCFLVVTHVSSLGWCSDLCWLSTPHVCEWATQYFFLAFLVDIQFFLLLIHFKIPWNERNISSKPQCLLVKQAIPWVRLHCDVTGMILSEGSCPQMVLNQVMNSCNLSRTR